jgi:uncharacterized RDD family membrane protein YckC
MFCDHCGTQRLPIARFCTACGKPFPPPPLGYAPFEKRVAAFLIDSILLAPLQFLPFTLWIYFVYRIATASKQEQAQFAVWFVPSLFGAILFNFLSSWLYHAWTESSRAQATFGKRWMKIIVTNMEGRPISFGHALARHFLKILAGSPLYLGYILAALTDRKQAMHDFYAKTLVLNRSPEILYPRVPDTGSAPPLQPDLGTHL